MVAYDCWPANDSTTDANMQAIASLRSVCGVLVLGKSAWYRPVRRPGGGFVTGKPGHLRNTAQDLNFLNDTMTDAEAFAK